MIKNKKQMYIVIGAFALILMLFTTTYAFFNYTRTGTVNIIRTGRINFNSEQGTAINLTNLFPIDVSEGIPNDATKVGTVTINITGDTTYGEGIEYLVSAVNVSNTVGSKSLPISIDVAVASNTDNTPATTLGTASNDYYNDRGSTTSYYSVLAGDVIENNDKLVVGYIAPGQTGVDGNIVIRAYLDASKIAISDTYPSGTVRNVITTGYSSSDCETALDGVTNASTYCATAASLQSAIDGEDLTSAQITLLVNAGIVEEYTDGTTITWVGTRQVFTTEEWNSLQTNGVSFQVKVEANEGTWIEEPPTLASCPGEGCVYTYTLNTLYTTWNTISETPSELTSADYVENYEDIENQYGVKSFFGLVLDNGKIVRAYSCGIYLGNPFCIEGSLSGEKKSENDDILYALFGNHENETGCYDAGDGMTLCYSEPVEFNHIYSISNGEDEVRVSYNWDMCIVSSNGIIKCYDD